MPRRASLLLFDTVALSNFAIAGRLDLLGRRYGGRAFVTGEVLAEMDRGIAAGYTALRRVHAALEKGMLTETALTRKERRAFPALLQNLGAGEASCIAIVKSRGGVVVTDDRAARAVCAERGLRFTGTIGILKAACRDGQLTVREADEALSRMIAGGFYSPVRRVSDIL